MQDEAALFVISEVAPVFARDRARVPQTESDVAVATGKKRLEDLRANAVGYRIAAVPERDLDAAGGFSDTHAYLLVVCIHMLQSV